MIAVDFAWPLALWTLILVPLAIAAYLWILRRQRRHAIVYSSIATVRAALPRRSKWRQHVPFALIMLAVASAAVGAARPQDTVKVPLSQTTIVLALDVSTSMCATDVEPNRLSASQAAAISFVEERDQSTRIGVVAFSGTAQTVVAPTTDTEELVDAIAGFTTSRGTAIGSAALTAIDAIALSLIHI